MSWGEAVAVYFHRRVIAMAFLGFSAGLPFLLVFSTLSAWLRRADVDLTTIGFFSWIGITYSIKVFWAPVVDNTPLPLLDRLLGRRRSWMLLAQCGIVAGLVGIALTGPQSPLAFLVGFGLLVAFSSATQDVVVDAYRIEAVERRLQGAMAATYVFGYRVALLAAGAGALNIAGLISWPVAYLCMAGLGLVGVVTTLSIREPERNAGAGAADDGGRAPAGQEGGWFFRAVASPFIDFFRRNGSFALVILLFIAVFRLSDITMGVMANPFYIDLGFSESQIGTVTKVFGFFMTLLGAFVGGLLVARFGVLRCLLLGAVLVAGTNLLFVVLAGRGADVGFLAVTISADNFSGGLAVSAFIAYLSGLTSRAYTATQYALFSSLMTLPGKFLGGFSGAIVEVFGYADFFLYAAAIGLPAILLVLLLLARPENAGLGEARSAD
ncbi:MAG TPA: MFS transporter [Kiloniellaceae bacterium]|nr:MFS transporter [Kiloniellaceae bacterium]